MSNLYIRNRTCGYICFVHSKQELVEFIVNYIPGRHLVLGDLDTFNVSMQQTLLKFIEDNPNVDCYSSSDIVDPVLQSRFVKIFKTPLVIDSQDSSEEFLSSDRSFLSALLYLNSLSPSLKLRAVNCNKNLLKIILNG